MKVYGFFQIELLIEFFQLLRHSARLTQRSGDDPQNVRFMNLDWLESHDVSVDRSNYDLIYTASLRESGTVPSIMP